MTGTGPPRPIIAVYDLDRTVTRLPTYSAFLLHAAWRIAPWRLALAPLIAPAAVLHGLRLIDRDRLKSWMWAVMLGRAHGEGIARAAAAFAARTLRRNIRPGARSSIAADRAGGATLVLATAAHELYAQPIAAALGFDAVIATAAEVGPEGRIGPLLVGGNVYAGAKRTALAAWLEREAIPRASAWISFHTDSASDLPLLEWADEAVAVNPSRRLARIAATRGWRIEDWG